MCNFCICCQPNLKACFPLLKEMRRRFQRLTRSLSIRQFPAIQVAEATAPSSADDEIPLFDCIFTTGLYHDRTSDAYVPFTRDNFPDGFKLPNGIEELCWPDARTWEPHAQQKTRTYNLVLTNYKGHRTFGYCRRLQAEGDDVCLPLAICVLTRHGRARGLFSQVH